MKWKATRLWGRRWWWLIQGGNTEVIFIGTIITRKWRWDNFYSPQGEKFKITTKLHLMSIHSTWHDYTSEHFIHLYRKTFREKNNEKRKRSYDSWQMHMSLQEIQYWKWFGKSLTQFTVTETRLKCFIIRSHFWIYWVLDGNLKYLINRAEFLNDIDRFEFKQFSCELSSSPARSSIASQAQHISQPENDKKCTAYNIWKISQGNHSNFSSLKNILRWKEQH